MNTNIRVGKVSNINYKTGMIRVTYVDKGKSVSSELPYANQNSEYFMPQIGEEVQINLLSNGTTKGVVLGTYWNKKNLPVEYGKGIYRKELSKTVGAAYLRYDDKSGEVLIKGPNAQLNAVNMLRVDAPHTSIESNYDFFLDTPTVNIKGGEKKKQTVNSELLNLEVKAELTEIKETIKKLQTKIQELYKLETKNTEIVTQELMKIKSESMEVNAGVDINIKSAGINYNVGGVAVTFNNIINRIERLESFH